MTGIVHIRTLLINGILILIIVLTIVEAISWSTLGEAKRKIIDDSGGTVAYLSLFTRTILLPETVTISVLAVLLSWTRSWTKIKTANLTWPSLLRYQLSFLPTLLIAFFIFIPFTQFVRYLLSEFPTYSVRDYWYDYVIRSYSWQMYFQYLWFVLLTGFCTLNLALIKEYTGRSSLKL